VNHICRINDDRLPNLEPFRGNAQKLSLDEVIDIVLNGVPRAWICNMDKQDFDPITKTLAEVVDFCERMEAGKDFEPARDGQKTSTKSKPDKKKDYSKQGKQQVLSPPREQHLTRDGRMPRPQETGPEPSPNRRTRWRPKASAVHRIPRHVTRPQTGLKRSFAKDSR
jgi:hypothetical protein